MGIYDGKKDRGIYDNYKAEDIPTITIPVEDYLKLLENKPVHAKWEQDSIWDYLECSNCHEPFVGTNYYNFCPNCGARMVEPQESEDKE